MSRNWMALIVDDLLDRLVSPRESLPVGQNFVQAPKSASDYDATHPQPRGAVKNAPMFTSMSQFDPNNPSVQTLPGFRLGSGHSSNPIEVGNRFVSGDNNAVRDFER